MARDTRLAAATVNAEADTLAARCNGGFIDVFDGARPDNADSALAGQVRGVVLGLASPAFGAAADGVITANAIVPGVAENSITPTWARVYGADHTSAVMDVSVGAADSNLILGPVIAGQVVACSSFVHTVAKSTPGS